MFGVQAPSGRAVIFAGVCQLTWSCTGPNSNTYSGCRPMLYSRSVNSDSNRPAHGCSCPGGRQSRTSGGLQTSEKCVQSSQLDDQPVNRLQVARQAAAARARSRQSPHCASTENDTRAWLRQIAEQLHGTLAFEGREQGRRPSGKGEQAGNDRSREAAASSNLADGNDDTEALVQSMRRAIELLDVTEVRPPLSESLAQA